MKNYALLVLFLLLFSCNNVNEAISYNDKIVNVYNKVAFGEAKLLYTVLSVDTAMITVIFNDFVKTLEHAKIELMQIGSYKEYDAFLNATLNVVEAYQDMTQNEMIDLIKFVDLHLFEIHQNDSLDLIIDSLLYNIDNKIEPAFLEFELAQQKFAVRHTFELEK